jgi:hypothetical protein
MRTFSTLGSVFGSVMMLAAYAAPAQAQASRTWVSGVGDDVNPCSRTAPCKTFPGAISKTATNGEINCLDPGGFGSVTITKSITIACEFTEGGILSAGTNGIVINVAGGIVSLRGLDIEGFATGLVGVNILQAARVNIEKSVIRGFRGGAGTGVQVNVPAVTQVVISDTLISDNLKGITLNTSGAGAVGLSGDNVRVTGHSAAALELLGNSTFATFKNSVFSHNAGNALSVTTGNGVISVTDSNITNNSGIGVNAASATSRIRIARNNIFNNVTAFAFGGGAVIESTADNRTGNNGGVQLPNGTIQLR